MTIAAFLLFLIDGFSDLRAAAGSCRITPERQVCLAGYLSNLPRLSEGVHDDLFARCLILESSTGRRAVFVSVDLIGFSRYDVLLIQKELGSGPNLFICSTHTHSGPDTIGIWGGNGKSGRDENYLKEVRWKILQLIREVSGKLEPARIFVSTASAEGLIKNYRIAGDLDTVITVLWVRGEHKNIAALINVGCHPETFGRDSKLISADFPGVLVQKVESMLSGTALFFNGLLGGMVSVDRENLKKAERGFELTNLVGNELARRVLKSLNSIQELTVDCFEAEKRTVAIDLENNFLREALERKIILSSKDTFDGKNLITEASVVTLGNFKIALVSGEMTPGLGKRVKESFLPDRAIVFGLANDEIGYILSPEEFASPIFKYERTMSVGSTTGSVIYEAIKKLSLK